MTTRIGFSMWFGQERAAEIGTVEISDEQTKRLRLPIPQWPNQLTAVEKARTLGGAIFALLEQAEAEGADEEDVRVARLSLGGGITCAEGVLEPK